VTRPDGAIQLSPLEEDTLREVTRLNTRVFALTFGLLGAAVLAAATLLLLVRDGATAAGPHLLSVFFWGYRVSGAGVLVGALWGFLYGSVLGALVYRAYVKTLRGRLAYLAPAADRRRSLRVSVLRLDGVGLGSVVGAMAALQLIVMTNWLVVDRTASQHVDATLLSQYLPGYSVSVAGSLIGGAQLFVLAFLAALALASTYNKIVDWRQASNPRRR
jgi:hypothetical protein